MQVIWNATRGAAALVVAVALAACDNEIPTAIGTDLFPGGVPPTTLLAEFTGSDLLLREEVLSGFGNPRLTPFLIAANKFDGALDAHPIADFTAIPDSVTYTADGASRREEISGYAGGRVLARVDSLATSPRFGTTLTLWELAQPWDSATVTWDNAVDRPGEQVPWTTPGGTLGRALDTSSWVPHDTAVSNDTVTWQLDSATVARMRSPDHPGLAVTSDEHGFRVQLSGLTFVGDARPSGKPDTLVEVRTMQGVQTFLYNPDTPQSTDVLSSGGLTGDRSVLTLDLEQEVEACPADGGPCSMLPLNEVTLNRASLIFEPVQVPGGHRPVVTPRVQLRRVAEPDLGRYAPLGEVIASDTISPSAFDAGTDRTFELDISNAVLQLLADTVPEVSIAVLTDFQTPDLGLVWFRRSPRLRLLYTLRTNPSLP